jgi:hypothetical protein
MVKFDFSPVITLISGYIPVALILLCGRTGKLWVPRFSHLANPPISAFKTLKSSWAPAAHSASQEADIMRIEV